MNLADYLVILAIILSATVGIVRGFLREAIAVATWLVALVFAWNFGEYVEPHLGGLLADPSVRPWAARAIIVLLVLLIGMATGAILSYFVRLSIFSGMDRFLGFVFGLLRGALLLGVFVILGQLVELNGERWWRQSLLIPYGESIANGLRSIVGEEIKRQREDAAST